MKEWERGIDNIPASQQEYLQEKCDLYNATLGKLDEHDGYHCEKCKNKGHFYIVTQNELFGHYEETMIPCKCQRARTAISKLEKSGLQNVVKQYTFDSYETPEWWQEDIKQKVMRFCQDDQNHWLFIGGQSGAGKSHLGTAAAVHYIRQGLDVVYMQWLDDIDKLLKASMEMETGDFERMMKEFKEARVLYIDDLFKEGNGAKTKEGQFSQAVVKRTFEILNYRVNNPGLITIISSEKTVSELREVDEAFAGRIVQLTDKPGYMINIRRDFKKNWRFRGIQEY